MAEQSVHSEGQPALDPAEAPRRSLRWSARLQQLQPWLRTRLFRALAGLSAAIAVYAGLGFFFVPWLLRTQLEKAVHEQTGCTLTLAQVRVHPFKLWFELSGIHLADRKGAALLDADRFALDFQALSSIWNRGLVFRAVAIEQPRLRVTQRPDGSVNLSDLSPREPSSPAAPDPAEVASDDAQDSTTSLWVQSFSLEGGRIDFEDCQRKTCFRRDFERLTLAVQNLRTTGRKGSFELATQLSDGAQVAWKGNVTLRPQLASEGRIALSNAPLASVAEYLGDALPIGSLAGTASLHGTYQVSLAPTGQTVLHIDDLAIDAARIRGKRGQGAGVDVERIELSRARVEVTRRLLDIEAVRLRGLRTHAQLNAEGQLNLTQIIARGRSHESEAASDAAAAPWALHVRHFELQDAAVDAEHQLERSSARVQIAPIGITVEDWSSDAAHPFSLQAEVGVQGGGQVSASGKVALAPLSADLKLSARGLDLALAQPYILEHADFALESGKLALQGTLALRAGAPRLAFNGGLELIQLHTLDNERREDLFNVRAMQLSGLRLETGPDLVEIERVQLREPYARVILRPTGTFNLSAAFAPKAVPRTRTGAAAPIPAVARAKPAAGATPAPPAAPTALRIRVMAIDRMRMNFSDTLIKPHFALNLARLNGTIRGIASDPSSRATVALQGTLGDNSPVRIAGTLRPFAYDRATDIQINADNISLPIFNPYSGRFAGYNIARGELSTEVRYKLQNRKLEASHSIRLDQLKWGEATETKEAAPLPVKLATVLLRDREGVINLELPLHGTLDDPSFSVWPLIWQVVQNVCIKAVTAPFDMLASVFAGTQDAKFVDFEPGRAGLSDRSKAAFSALSAALVDREELTLNVPVRSVPELDRPALLQIKLEQQIDEAFKADASLRKTAADFVSLDADDQIDLLRDLYEHRYGDEPTIPDPPPPAREQSRAQAKAAEKEFELGKLRDALRAKLSVSDEDLEQLARARGEAIERAVASSGKLATHRILLSREGDVTTEQGKIRLALELE